MDELGPQIARPVFTALLIAILIVAGAAGAVGGSLIYSRVKGRLPSGDDAAKQLSGRADKLIERTVRDLRLGDVIQTDGRDFLVEGLVLYDEAGHKWTAGKLVDGSDERWLFVGIERVGAGSTRLGQLEPDIQITGYPPEAIVHGPHRFSLDKRGTATCKVSGEIDMLGSATDPGAESVHRCRWWLYSAAGPNSLILEQWGEDFRAITCKTLSGTDFEMIPGS